MTSRGARAQVILSKKPLCHKGKLRDLSEKSPNMSHADWAMENMCRTPGEITMIGLCRASKASPSLECDGHWDFNVGHTSVSMFDRQLASLTLIIPSFMMMMMFSIQRNDPEASRGIS